MKIAGAILIFAAALLSSGQAPKAPAAAAPASAPRGGAPGHAVMAELEEDFENRIKAIDPADPVDRLGAATAVYVNGVGLVLTTPVDLIPTPQVSPFNPTISPATAASVHKRKIARLPLVQQALRESVKNAAGRLTTLPAGERIIYALRMVYFEWEDKSGLPSQIVAVADRDSALAGRIQVDLQ